MSQTDDSAVRLEALDPRQSFIVQAPAGSGKTSLLVQRFLSLLAVLEGSPEQCVAITFTRKAALEMRDRVIQALKAAQNPTPPEDAYHYQTWVVAKKALLRDQALGWDLCKQPDRLRIQTIDAFCASIVHQRPLTGSFGKNFKISEDPRQLYEQAIRQLLRRLEQDPSDAQIVGALLAHLDNRYARLIDLLIHLLSHREQWLPYVGYAAHDPNIRDLLEKGLEAILQNVLTDLVSAIPETAFQCPKLDQWPGAALSDHCAWFEIAELFLTKNNELRKTLTVQQGFAAPSSAKDKAEKERLKAEKQAMLDYLAALETAPKFLDSLARLRNCPPLRYECSQWNTLDALMQLLPLFVAELQGVFAERLRVDFNELTLCAKQALVEEGSPTALALQLDYQIQHLLIDEFQDTSVAQFRFLEALTAEWQGQSDKTLFLVGDPMQSIYRFRQAEVGLFLRCAQQGFGAIPLKSLQLKTNFRSDPLIVDWVNQTFSVQFPRVSDLHLGAIQYEKVVPALGPLADSKCAIYRVKADEEIALIVQAVQESLRETSGNIAVLVQSRSHLASLLLAFKENQIAYQGIDLECLADRLVIRDLLALSRALIHLGDRIAWLALLRTPWLQLSLIDLEMIASHQPEQPLWYTLQRYLDLALSPSAQENLASAVPVLQKALLNRGRSPFHHWILETWVALGGPKRLYDAQSIEDVEAFFEVLETNAHWVEGSALETRLQRLYSNALDLQARVQVMTIHKAKGLEFDTVIVPGVGKKTAVDPKKLLSCFEYLDLSSNKSHLILAPIQALGAEADPIDGYLRQIENQKAKNEVQRLWYVAATRAKRRLYWFMQEL